MVPSLFPFLMRRGVLCAALLAAGQSGAMGLIAAYGAALQHDPVYRSAVHDQQAGAQYGAIGRSALLPTLQYTYGNSKNKAELTAPGAGALAATTHPEYTSISSSVTLRQTLFNLDAVARYRQGMAQAGYSAAQFASRSQDLMIRLVTAYADVKYGQDQLALLGAQRDALAEQKRANQRLFQHGEGTRTDVLETEAKLDVAEAQLIEAQDSLMTARVTLAAMIGQDAPPLDSLVTDFTVPALSVSAFEDWQALAGKHNAELAAGRFALESAEQEIHKGRAGHAPRLDLNASVSRASSDTLTTWKQDSTVRSIGIQLVVPLYSGGLATAVTSQAVANRDKARSDLEAGTSRVMIELRKQFNAARSSIAKLAALQKSADSAALLVQATRQSVKGGVRVNLDVLNAEQQLQAARRDLAQARYSYLIGFLKLRVAAGTLDSDDLRTVAAYFSAVQ